LGLCDGRGRGSVTVGAVSVCERGIRLNEHAMYRDTELLAHLFIECLELRWVFVQDLLETITSLHTLFAEREPRAALLNDPLLDRHIDTVSNPRYTHIVPDV